MTCLGKKVEQVSRIKQLNDAAGDRDLYKVAPQKRTNNIKPPHSLSYLLGGSLFSPTLCRNQIKETGFPC